jgi:hypothetical protein
MDFNRQYITPELKFEYIHDEMFPYERLRLFYEHNGLRYLIFKYRDFVNKKFAHSNEIIYEEFVEKNKNLLEELYLKYVEEEYMVSLYPFKIEHILKRDWNFEQILKNIKDKLIE